MLWLFAGGSSAGRNLPSFVLSLLPAGQYRFIFARRDVR